MALSTSLLLRRAIFHRRGRLAAALTCLTMSAAIVTAMTVLYADLGAKLNREFRAFGPNVIITTPNGQALPPETIATVGRIAGPQAASVATATVVAETITHAPLPVTGADLSALATMHPEWKLTPLAAAANAMPVFIGQRAWESLGHPASINISLNGKTIAVTPTATVESGGAEEAQIYLSTQQFLAWSAVAPTTIEARIPGGAQAVNQAIAQLRVALPSLEIQPVRRLVEGQQHIVERTRSLMLLSACIIVVTIAIAVLATLSALVLDRRRDYAIMKAVGCSASGLHSLFLLETGALAIVGAALGLAVGLLAAFAIGEANFHTRIAMHPVTWPAPLAVNLIVAAIAVMLPLRRLTSIEPAALLRGE